LAEQRREQRARQWQRGGAAVRAGMEMAEEAPNHDRNKLAQQGERPAVSGGEQRQRGRAALGAVAPINHHSVLQHARLWARAAEGVAQRLGERQPCRLRPAATLLVERQRLRQSIGPFDERLAQQQSVIDAHRHPRRGQGMT
jgi:hypothetical protein